MRAILRKLFYNYMSVPAKLLYETRKAWVDGPMDAPLPDEFEWLWEEWFRRYARGLDRWMLNDLSQLEKRERERRSDITAEEKLTTKIVRGAATGWVALEEKPMRGHGTVKFSTANRYPSTSILAAAAAQVQMDAINAMKPGSAGLQEAQVQWQGWDVYGRDVYGRDVYGRDV